MRTVKKLYLNEHLKYMINRQDFLDHLEDNLPEAFESEEVLKSKVNRALKTYIWKTGDILTSTNEEETTICVFSNLDDDETFTSSFSINLGKEVYTVTDKEQFFVDNFRKATEKECNIISKAISESGYRWLYGMIVPKFGVNQYIVEESTKKVYVVTGMVGKVYECIDLDGNKATFLINDKERNIPLHAWTIDDAEAGQILVTKKDKVYVNFKEIDPNNSFYFLSTWDIDGTDSSVNMNPGDDWISDAFVPANKQQKEEVRRIMELNGFTYVKLNISNNTPSSDNKDLLSLVKNKYPDISNKEILKLLTDAIYKLVNDN